MSVTVYSMPTCPQCDATYRMLDKLNVDYQVIDITADPEALTFVQSLGHRAAPVVVAGEDNWAGFRPDKIKAVATALSKSLVAA